MVDDGEQPTNPQVDVLILQELAIGTPLSPAQWAELKATTLADYSACKVFDITSETVDVALKARSHLLQFIYPSFSEFCRYQLHWNECPLDVLWRLWLPLVTQLIEHHQSLNRSLIQGILGGQGTGKTTLAAILSFILNQSGYRACGLSLDDLYKPYRERQQLQQIDPRLRWRGPPGTHDIDLGLQVLHQLKQTNPGESIDIPRFDKSAWNGAGDRTTPLSVADVDILLFEGWFVGVRPIDPQLFDIAPLPITTDDDRQFARDCNARLYDYLPLWDQLDRLIVLYPINYRLSQHWRQQAEQQMVATGRSGMSDQEVAEFVEYFWRSLHPDLFITPLLTNSEHVDLVIEINPDHTPGRLYSP